MWVENPSRITHHHHSLILRYLCQFLRGFPFSPIRPLGGNPAEVRNCLTVDALIPKFSFSGSDPIAFATFSFTAVSRI